MTLLIKLSENLKGQPKKVLFPEGDQVEIVQAAVELAAQQLAVPIILGKADTVAQIAQANQLDLSDVEVIELGSADFQADCLKAYIQICPDFTEKRLRLKWKNPLNAAMILLKIGYGDGVVAGMATATEAVILAAMTFVGMQEGINSPSSSFIMQIPNFQGDQGELLTFADCAVCVDPDAESLSAIALATANTVQKLLHWPIKMAFLSYSSMGSGTGTSVDKVRQAVQLTREKAPDLRIIGEVQVDAALVPSVAHKKLPPDEDVVGDANVLIFPNLDAGNIAYKLVQRTTGGSAFGPILQGFAKPISDLSRGATVEEVIGATIIVSNLV